MVAEWQRSETRSGFLEIFLQEDKANLRKAVGIEAAVGELKCCAFIVVGLVLAAT